MIPETADYSTRKTPWETAGRKPMRISDTNATHKPN
jgi:hypothetical protein